MTSSGDAESGVAASEPRFEAAAARLYPMFVPSFPLGQRTASKTRTSRGELTCKR